MVDTTIPEAVMSLREMFGNQLAALANEDARIVVLDGDLANSTKADMTLAGAPSQFLEMGIAEQNMIGVAAGLATIGCRPWISSFAAFLTERALDQVKVSIAQPQLPVVLAGGYAGLLNGRNGKTHQALTDLAIMRLIPGMTVFAPCDAHELREMMHTATAIDGPVYLRLTRDPSPLLPVVSFRIGKSRVLLDGGAHPDVVLVSTGVQSVRAVQAAQMLHELGIDGRVVHLGTLKPIDADDVMGCLDGPLVITVEDHLRMGGLGGLIAEITSEYGPRRVVRFGLHDYGESADNESLLSRYSLSPERIAENVARCLQGKETGIK